MSGRDPLEPWVEAPPLLAPACIAGVVVGELMALTDNGWTALVRHAGQVALGDEGMVGLLKARSVVDLHGARIGSAVVLMFEQGDPTRPIVMGVLRQEGAWPMAVRPEQVDVSVDGERMVISAKEQLVLRCGKARITLTQAGKVLIEGSYVLSKSTGVNRIKGGSVQLN